MRPPGLAWHSLWVRPAMQILGAQVRPTSLTHLFPRRGHSALLEQFVGKAFDLSSIHGFKNENASRKDSMRSSSKKGHSPPGRAMITDHHLGLILKRVEIREEIDQKHLLHPQRAKGLGKKHMLRLLALV
ncbi:hypothetical protein Pfo_021730 [Paulownia fortunei]|nr:hypothetical protein Pfo_021730 [Paulownia fortunei]